MRMREGVRAGADRRMREGMKGEAEGVEGRKVRFMTNSHKSQSEKKWKGAQGEGDEGGCGQADVGRGDELEASADAPPRDRGHDRLPRLGHLKRERYVQCSGVRFTEGGGGVGLQGGAQQGGRQEAGGEMGKRGGGAILQYSTGSGRGKRRKAAPR